MPQSPTNSVNNRLLALQQNLGSLKTALSRVLQANGPYLDMRPWRISYLQNLLRQAVNLHINTQSLNVVVLQMLGHVTGPTRNYLLNQQIAINNILQTLIQMRSEMEGRIHRDSSSLARERQNG